MGNKKKQPSVQELIFNYKETSIIPSFPHAGKNYSQPRILSGRGFGKTCMIRIADGKPVVIGNQNGIKIVEDMELFKDVKPFLMRTIPSNIPPQEFKPTGKTLEDVLAMKALNTFTWQPPKDKEERKRLLEIIKKGKIDHFITGGPKL